jgi:RND superfamily putative drug exporter
MMRRTPEDTGTAAVGGRSTTDSGARSTSFTERLARRSATHPWRTMAIWLALIVVAVLSMSSLLSSGITSDIEFRGQDPDSVTGQKLLQDRLTGPQRLSDFVIVRSDEHKVGDAAYEAYVAELAGEIAGLGDDVVGGVLTYYETGDPTLVSKDERSTLLQVVMAADTGDEAIEHVDELHAVVVENQRDGFTLQQTGDVSLGAMGTELAESDLQRAEIFGMPAALIVLLLVFGAVLAATMPIVLSIISILLGIVLTGLIGQVYPMNTFVLNILVMMGLAVGIDYTLFIISRYREERTRGLSKLDAIGATGATANRAIFFSGMTVFLAMLGMVIVPLDITISMGLGVMLVVFTTLLTSLILLPAVIGLLGDRVNALRIPLVGRRSGASRDGHVGVWERLSHSIMRRPVVWLTIAVAVLVAAAAPVLFIETGNNGMTASHYPDDQYAKQGWDTLARDFSLGKANPLYIVIDGDAASDGVTRGVAALQAAMETDGRFGPAQVTANDAGDLTLVSTTLAGEPAGDETQGIVRELRAEIVPVAFTGHEHAVYVTGNTAFVVDYLDFFDRWLPIALGVVLSLSFVLLLVAFRSIVIPAKAILMNLLSVGAAYGLLVLVFQRGVGADLLGFTQVDTVEAWVPLMLFSMLFGLSMDYQVFLLSRIKERFDHTGDTRGAVAYGIGRTASIITGAAAIMVCVFGGMATGEMVQFQQMGFGLAVAILVDATVVRTIIVPAAMELLGDWNWYLPRWLEWLPNVSVEGHTYEPEVAPAHGPEADRGRREPAHTPQAVPAGRPATEPARPPQTRPQPVFMAPRPRRAPAGK